jgi:hypothetical protein
VNGDVSFSLKAIHHRARALILSKAQDTIRQLRHQYGNGSIPEEILAHNDVTKD